MKDQASVDALRAQIVALTDPSPAQWAAWRRLWAILLADAPRNQNATEAAIPMPSEQGSADTELLIEWSNSERAASS